MKTTHILPICLSLVLLAGCKKDKIESIPVDETPTTPPDNYTSLSDFYAKNGAPVQTFKFYGATGGQFVSANGSTIQVPANTYTGTSGEITLEFKDIFTKSEMILSNATTNFFDGSPLVSGGEFYLKVYDNKNKPLNISNGNVLSVTFPPKTTADKDTMKAYFSNRDTTTGMLSWLPADRTMASISLTSSSGAVSTTYNLTSGFNSNFTWHNADHPIPGSTATTITLQIVPNDLKATVYLVLRNLNSVAGVNIFNNGSATYRYAPLGEYCTLLAVGIKNNKLYCGQKDITIAANQTMGIVMNEMSTEEFKKLVKSFN